MKRTNDTTKRGRRSRIRCSRGGVRGVGVLGVEEGCWVDEAKTKIVKGPVEGRRSSSNLSGMKEKQGQDSQNPKIEEKVRKIDSRLEI